MGDRWSGLVIREAFFGVRRFDDFQRRLAIATNILAQRLERLTDHGVLERVPYQYQPVRHEYRLTEKGIDLYPVPLAMLTWGDRWLTGRRRPPVPLTHLECGVRFTAVLCCNQSGEPISRPDVKFTAPSPTPRPMRPFRRPAAGRLRTALLLAVAVVPTSLGTGFLNPFPARAEIATVGSSQSSSRSNIPLSRPSGTSAGHVMVASLVSNSDALSFTAPAGWTLVGSASIPGASLQAAYVKVAGADEPGSYTWSVCKSRSLAGGWTVNVSGDTVLVGAGDISSCNNNNDEATAQLLDAVVATDPNARVFTTGDNVYDNGTAAEFANCYNPTWGRHKARTSPSVGNHEYGTAGASGYFNYFGAAAGEPGKGYYDYTLGGWHVVVLNSQCSAVGGCFAGSAQEQWLRSRLAAVSAECTVAYWHHPRFSSGANHGSNPTYEPLWQALYDAGADLVLNGHDHLYERFGPQTPAGQADATHGIRQITIGTGGRSLYETIDPIANSQFLYNANYGILKLTLRGGSYDWQMTRVGGVTVDAGTSNCHGAPPAPPPPPPPPPDGGPIAAVGTSSSGSSSSRTSITINRPSGTQAGHVMLASVIVNDDDVITAPAGWTVVRQDTITGTLCQAIYYRVAGSSEPGAYTWTLPDWRRIAGGITAYSGVNTTTPIDVHAASVQTTATTAVTAPSVNTTVG